MESGKLYTSRKLLALTATLHFVLVLSLACGSAKRPSTIEATGQAHPPNSLSRQDRVDVFEEVWQTINGEYYDQSFNGVNWQEVRHRYRPRVEAAPNDFEFYKLFELMLAELRDAHTVYIRPQSQNGEGNFRPAGSVGISLGEAEGKVVVVEVEPDSDAARAGVKPGMILQTVNGRTVEQLFTEIRSRFPGSSSERSMKSVMMNALLYGGFLGPSRTFGITDFDGKVLDVAVTRFGARPDSPVLTSRRLASGYGYIKFDSWKTPIDERFGTELARLTDTPGLIIDLRNNGGGSGDVLLNIASNFFPAETSYGGFKTRAGGLQQYFTHKTGKLYRGSIVILVNETSASASETFSQFMQESGRATIIGRQTCGCVLNSYSKKMKDGGTLRYSARVYISPKGRILEGTGVAPDEAAVLTVADLRQGRDTALEAAENRLKHLQQIRNTAGWAAPRF